MKIQRMHLVKGDSKTVAYCDVQTDDKIVIKGFKLINGTKGLFLSAPNEKGKDGKYYDSVILPKELRDNLEKMAIEEYNNA